MNKISRLYKSFGYAFKGIATVMRNEQNMKIHLLAVVIVIIAGVCLTISLSEWIILVLCFGAVLSSEMLNSAIEKVVDLISPDYHKTAGQVKDMAAGAVLIAAVASAVIAGMIFIPKLI